MSRAITAALFALFVLSSVAGAAGQVPHVVDAPSLRGWLILGFWVLKIAVVGAFWWFIVARPESRKRSREPIAFAACAAAMLGAVALQGPGPGASTPRLIAGEALVVVAYGWMLASVLALGPCFGVLPEVRGLVTRGPYRLVRHPLYLGELAACAGLVIGAPIAWNLVSAAVLVAGQVVRMGLEERALAGEFPQYAAYAARTPRIVPWRLRGRATTTAAGAALLLLVAVVLWTVYAAPASAATRLAAPSALSPADGAALPAAPGFSWKPVKGAARYEFELSADDAFHSIVAQGDFFTRDTYATVPRTMADGRYYWRVRGVNAKAQAGRWSRARSITKAWTDRPVLLGPADGGTVDYPQTPLVLRWAPVSYAYKYLVTIATDPGLAHSALGDHIQSVETSATSYALPMTLAPGRYYWAVTPEDSDKHPGTSSAVASFVWSWPTQSTPQVTDLNADPRVYDPRFSWTPVPGAAQYQVEINSSQDFAVGSRVCCDDAAVGTSMSPTKLLPNNTYYWRVRAVDMDGHAGVWNAGPSFEKTFDEVAPTIPGLRLRDNLADQPPAGGSTPPATGSPVVAWDPVPGASSYEVTVAPWEAPGFCDWTQNNILVPNARTFLTATTAWTALGPSTLVKPVGNAFPTVANDGIWHLFNGASYCVRVRARSDRDAKNNEVLSDWTQLGGEGHAAFTYSPPVQTCAPGTMPASSYAGPTGGTVSPRMPLFTWKAVPGACGYFVVVARDADFTKIVDVALTDDPAYAPRGILGPTTYPDETTSYYWAVMPTRDPDGGGLSTQPQQDSPQAFQKRSVPPALLGPTGGQTVTSQPVFSWTPAEGARSYRIQVASDPTFGSPIADVQTNSTSFTSTSALPADSTLYWRVRADDENHVGLSWSATGTFRRRFQVPALLANPTGGQAIPALAWAPVDGAVSYDMHVEQADGTKRDFTMRSTAFTPTAFYGTGVWHWQVRADFRSGTSTVSGGYSSMVPFAREIATPTAIHTVKANGGVLLDWDPATQALKYRVQIASDDSFTNIVEQADVSNTSYAPRMLAMAFSNGSPLYWRVATIDEGYNLGGWNGAPLKAAQTLKLRTKGSLRVGRSGRVRVTATNGKGRGLARVTVRISGGGVISKPARTDGKGRVTLRLKPIAKGKVTLTAEKAGYAPATATVRVR